MTKEERKKIKDKYKDKVPEPLTSQFVDKTPKNEAIKSYREQKAKTTELFPFRYMSNCYYKHHKNNHIIN